MPDAFPMAVAMQRFLSARVGSGSQRRMLTEHPELLNFGIEYIDEIAGKNLAFCYPDLTQSDAQAKIKAQRALLVRCQQIGVARAFSEIEAQRGTTPVEPGHHTAAKVLGLIAAVAVLAVVVVVGLHTAGSHPTASAQNGASTTAGDTASSQSLTTEQGAAQHLAALLAQSATDRSTIVNAVNDVSQCGSNLSHDRQIFQNATASRQELLSKLSGLPGSSALPAKMTQALAKAWQVSEQADRDFAAWAQDENSQECTANGISDSNYQAAEGPDNQATAYKTAFVDFWNPIAQKYGLRTYRPGEL
jgi:hypothetical protein